MPLAESAAWDDIWSLLQQPAYSAEIESRCRLLLAALDVGWEVEEPVYLRPRLSEDGPRVYHFILRRSSFTPPCLLSVPEGPEVERLVREAGLAVSVNK
jgi:hypothetical protein